MLSDSVIAGLEALAMRLTVQIKRQKEATASIELQLAAIRAQLRAGGQLHGDKPKR